MPAAALYTSPLFRKSLLAALDDAKKIYILSAKHGVLSCDDVIEPYDVTLKTLSRNARKAWGEAAGDQLRQIVDRKTIASMYCGEEYIAPLRDALTTSGTTTVEPLAGRSLGQRLQDLTAINEEQKLRADVSRFYRMMRLLWLAQDGGRVLGDANGKMSWPGRGVYFIVEMPGGLSHGTMPRIVRIGTHAISSGSRTSLWNRLSTHRGTTSGGGSHRSSIFRSHVGQAIMQRERTSSWPETWAVGQSAPQEIRGPEAVLEKIVSRTIGEMRVIWLAIPDEAGPMSERAYIERNAIGLLSRSNLLMPFKDQEWLGRYSRDWRICVSGLWNLNHVFMRPDVDFLDRMQETIRAMIGDHPGLTARAPSRPATTRQYTLFRTKRTNNGK